MDEVDATHARRMAPWGDSGANPPLFGAKLVLLPFFVKRPGLLADLALPSPGDSNEAEVALAQPAVDTAGDSQEAAIVHFIDCQRPDSPRSAWRKL